MIQAELVNTLRAGEELSGYMLLDSAAMTAQPVTLVSAYQGFPGWRYTVRTATGAYVTLYYGTAERRTLVERNLWECWYQHYGLMATQ
jgi:hypothetical protein